METSNFRTKAYEYIELSILSDFRSTMDFELLKEFMTDNMSEFTDNSDTAIGEWKNYNDARCFTSKFTVYTVFLFLQRYGYRFVKITHCCEHHSTGQCSAESHVKRVCYSNYMCTQVRIIFQVEKVTDDMYMKQYHAKLTFDTVLASAYVEEITKYCYIEY